MSDVAVEFDPFADLSKIKLDQSFTETVGVRKLLITVPVDRPNPQDFMRVHPDPAYRGAFSSIELKADRETYLVLPNVAAELPSEVTGRIFYTAINRQGVVRLWPVTLPPADGRINEWHRSLGEAAERAITRWVRVKANRDLGAYEITEAVASFADPVWPTEPFEELLRIGFRGRVISDFDHPVVKRLLGQA